MTGRRDGNLTTISSRIVNKTRILFVVGSILQIVAVLGVVSYISIKDAIKRSSFLSDSSQQTIGLLIGTGDLFQLKALISSFKSNDTPFAQILDPEGRDFLAPSNPQSTYSLDIQPRVQWREWSLIIKTEYPIIYDQSIVGRLVFLNRVGVNDWLLLIPILFGLTILFSLVQSRILQKHSIVIGEHIAGLASIFEHSSSKEQINLFYNQRNSSQLSEVEGLAEKIKGMLTRIIDAAAMEKEAAVGRITSHISHDLRAPLGAFEILLNMPDSTPISRIKNHIKFSLNRINAMIEALRNVEAENLVRRLNSLLDFRYASETLMAKAKVRGIDLIVPKNTFHDLWIDALKIERAWTNLVSNSLDAATSWVCVDAFIEDNKFMLRVTDDGPGVPDEIADKLFQRGVTAGKDSGTGLGLAYVKQVIEGHGGEVFYRRSNAKTIFEFYVPQAWGVADDYQFEQNQIIAAGIRSKRILIDMQPPSMGLRLIEVLSECRHPNIEFVNEHDQQIDLVVTNNSDRANFYLDLGLDVSELGPTVSEDVATKRILKLLNLDLKKDSDV